MILILGKNGQVGSACKNLLPNATAIARDTLDFSQLNEPNFKAKAEQYFKQVNPHTIINGIAYTAVDKAEEERKQAKTINTDLPDFLAHYCKANNATLVHYSTDYVYSGDGKEPFTEQSPHNPQNYYGKTKLEGDYAIEQSGLTNYFIFRTSWVYDAFGSNFPNTMLRLGVEKEQLSIVADQHGAPSYAPHLSEATTKALQQNKNFGTYHMCNSGYTNWHEFACAIFKQAKANGINIKANDIKPVPSSAYPTPAKRPLNSRLSLNKLQSNLGINMPTWQDGLTAFFAAKLAN